MSLEWNDWEKGYYHATDLLIGKLVALRKEIESVKAPLQKIILDLIDEKNSLCRELDLLRADRVAEQDRAAQLEAAHKEIESWKGVAKQLGNDADTLRTHLSFAKDELNRLRGVLEEMELECGAMRATIQVALVVLDEVCGNINPERGYADELETDVKRAIAAISLYNARGNEK